MEQILDKSDYITDKSQLVKYFLESFKDRSEFKLGVEFEKLGVNIKNSRSIGYFGETGALEFLKRLKLLDDYNEVKEGQNVLGLTGPKGQVSLEPGSQFEYSTHPLKNLKDIEDAFLRFNTRTGKIAQELGVAWIGSGAHPLSTYDAMELLPKERYNIMWNYLPTKGSCGRVMMKETAGIQTSIDFHSEDDAMRKLRVALGISPVITAMFANSPIRGGKLTGYKSFRAYAWLNTDNDRCGLISKKIIDGNFSFARYVEVLLDVPMLFLQRENQLVNTTGMTFREYLNGSHRSYRATMDDWFLHMTTFFPEIRMKNFLEIRNCDSQRIDLTLAFPAFIKGVMYHEGALEQAEEIIKELSWEELNILRNEVPAKGLDTKFKKYKLAEIAAELISIAEFSLKTQTPEYDETIYLAKIKELVSEGKTPADIVIQNWESGWNRDIRKFIEYSRLY